MVPVHGQAGVPVTETGEIEMTIPFEDETWACEAILSMGSAIEVLRPASMRKRIADEARAAAERYA
ncbi:MAG TPA: hypothetical protein DGG94_16380 [Micromonosporaceae bacterium]|nr:hypothetical protein [Micromonosporaceae bacterium]